MTRRRPRDGGAEVWTLDLDAPADVSCLSADETARAARFHHEIHRRRFAVGRASLRTILSRHVGVAPSSLVFAYGAHGKPSLVGGELHFNIAHTGGVAKIALSGSPVGIDVERIDPSLGAEGIGEVAFAPDEIAVLRDIPPHLRAQAFTKVWTSREALVKGLGLGLSMPPVEIAVCADPLLKPRLLRGGAGWRLESLDAPPGHVATLAVAAGEGVIIQGRWPDEAQFR